MVVFGERTAGSPSGVEAYAPIFAQYAIIPCRWGSMTPHDLQSLAGVGPATAKTLADAGFGDRDSIASATVEQLVAVRGFAEARATALITEAQNSVGSEEAVDLESVEQTTTEAPEQDEDQRPKSRRKTRKKLRARHADLKKRAKKARKKSKTASSKKKRRRWAAEADRLARKAKKTKKRLSRLR